AEGMKSPHCIGKPPKAQPKSAGKGGNIFQELPAPAGPEKASSGVGIELEGLGKRGKQKAGRGFDARNRKSIFDLPCRAPYNFS
ncbi:MAG: hypothetical protein Q3X94_05090, partial [Oscillospiraceae bacterium]|nr:hypothetical protein [Oscillospiraceae bacterium]